MLPIYVAGTIILVSLAAVFLGRYEAISNEGRIALMDDSVNTHGYNIKMFPKIKNSMGCKRNIISWLFQCSLEGSPAKFPHNPILYARGLMYVVVCFATKKQQKQRIVP